jgi:hypothetical protein
VSWFTNEQRSRIRRHGAVGVHGSRASTGVSGQHPFSPGPSKTELREQAAEAVASYEGRITRCPPKRRKAP